MRAIIFATLITVCFVEHICHAQETAKKSFRVFSYDKQLIEAGAEKYRLGTSHYWFDRKDGKYLMEEPSPERTRRVLHDSPTIPLVIDIENWELNDETRDEVFRKMETVANTVKEINPSYKIGWYRFLPLRNYNEPVWRSKTHPKYLEWQQNNRENIKKFGHLFDFLCPSLYSFHESHSFEKWAKYADANLRECVYAKKQNYAFIWAEFHQSGTQGGGVSIPDDLWRKQLALLRDHEHCHGVFIFAGPEGGNWRKILIEELLTPDGP